MNFRPALALLWLSIPAVAQYAGPAILSRGEAPASMRTPTTIRFRPFVEVSASYSTGLSGVSVNNQGQLSNDSSAAVGLRFGVSGTHRTAHTTVGLDYSGAVNHNLRRSFYDGFSQSLLLGIDHQFSPRVRASLSESAGMFSRLYGPFGLSQTIPFDPAETTVPRTDYFDNRTIYVTTVANLTIQHTRRLSTSFGGSTANTLRRSSSLTGLRQYAANGDVQYRLSRRRTVGGGYTYQHMGYPRAVASADIHGAAVSYSEALTRRLEVSGYAGFMRLEYKSVQEAQVDPVLAALLGIRSASQIVHNVQYVPNMSARLSRAVNNGVFYLNGGITVTPGNGIFLASTARGVGAGYAYTGLRYWSFSTSANYTSANSLVNVRGQYRTTSASVSGSRKIVGPLHFVVNYSVRKYGSPDFENYNRLLQDATIGLGLSPGEVPLRIW